MKLKFLCRQCLLENAPEGGGYFTMPYDPNSIVDLTDSYYYEFTCRKGHKNMFFLALPRYAILFDMGISAYLDGYYREAVMDFAASYERFHEYCINLILWNEKSLQTDDLTILWKRMSHQSERQLGAFTALYYKQLGDLPDEFSQKAVEFRNKVTHRGYFPTREEAYSFALNVAEYVKAIIPKLSEHYGFDPRGNYPALRIAHEKGIGVEGHVHMTVITQYSCGNDFDESIEMFKKQFHNNYEK